MNKHNVEIKKIGVWMDHAEAKFMEPEKELNSMRTIHSASADMKHFPGESSDGTKIGLYRSTNNEAHKHRKEENASREYFEYLAGQLEPYDEIFLFGPTTAANEFANYISREKLLVGKKIHMEKTDYLTDPQKVKLIKEFFSLKQIV
jgi:hypothetical protein